MHAVIVNASVFAAGIFLLIGGSDFLIQGCVKFARLFKLSPLFIGIIVVAFGTSAPELAVGIIAVIKGQEAIALGNIIGSNICNIGLILGICCILRPLKVNKSIFRKELPIMLLAVALLFILSWDLVLDRVDALIFLLLFILFCLVSYRGAKLSSEGLQELNDFQFNRLFKKINSRLAVSFLSFLLIGVIVLGAHLMVHSGVNLAKIFGISPWIIGLTVFAIGTSLPELAASLSAVFKKVPSISVGNIVGSNIFNILLVLSIVAFIKPVHIADASVRMFELPALILFSIVLFIFMRTHYKISRLEGLILLLGYAGFIGFLVSR